jgi:hypothetical protein
MWALDKGKGWGIRARMRVIKAKERVGEVGDENGGGIKTNIKSEGNLSCLRIRELEQGKG